MHFFERTFVLVYITAISMTEFYLFISAVAQSCSTRIDIRKSSVTEAVRKDSSNRLNINLFF